MDREPLGEGVGSTSESKRLEVRAGEMARGEGLLPVGGTGGPRGGWMRGVGGPASPPVPLSDSAGRVLMGAPGPLQGLHSELQTWLEERG